MAKNVICYFRTFATDADWRKQPTLEFRINEWNWPRSLWRIFGEFLARLELFGWTPTPPPPPSPLITHPLFIRNSRAWFTSEQDCEIITKVIIQSQELVWKAGMQVPDKDSKKRIPSEDIISIWFHEPFFVERIANLTGGKSWRKFFRKLASPGI